MGRVFLDTETTGLDPAVDEILEIALISDTGHILFHSRVKPTRKTEWPEAELIHGIGPADVEHALPLADLLPVIRYLTAGCVVVAHVAEFDVGFFPEDTFEHVECTRLLAKELEALRGEPFESRRLEALAAKANHIWTGREHSALADAFACRDVWQWLVYQIDAYRLAAAA